MHVVLEFAVRLEFHSANDPDHGGRIGAQSLGHRPHAHQNKLARPFEGRANDLLSFGTQQVDASRRAHDWNRTRQLSAAFSSGTKACWKAASCQHQTPRMGRCPHLPGGARGPHFSLRHEPVELRSTGQVRTSAPTWFVVDRASQDAYNAGAALIRPTKPTAGGHSMDPKSAPQSRSRRDFLTTTSLLAAAVAAPRTASALTAGPRPRLVNSRRAPGALRKIPIGVFDPAFPNLSLDEMIDKFAGLGVEAVEIGTGGYPNSTHCPVKELLEDPAKARCLEKEIRRPQYSGGDSQLPRQPGISRSEDRGARCRILPAHRAAGRAPGSECDCGFLRLPRRQSHGHHAQLGHLPLAARVRADARLAVEGKSDSILEAGGQVRPRTRNPQDRAGDASRILWCTTPKRCCGCARPWARRLAPTAISAIFSGSSATRSKSFACWASKARFSTRT